MLEEPMLKKPYGHLARLKMMMEHVGTGIKYGSGGLVEPVSEKIF